MSYRKRSHRGTQERVEVCVDPVAKVLGNVKFDGVLGLAPVARIARSHGRGRIATRSAPEGSGKEE
eukprot:1248914-Lingulodinium_polyedra.AAC.1